MFTGSNSLATKIVCYRAATAIAADWSPFKVGGCEVANHGELYRHGLNDNFEGRPIRNNESSCLEKPS